MELRRKLLRACLYMDYSLRRLTGSGSFGSRRAVPVTKNPPGIIAGTLQQALWRHYVKQFNEAACSVATVINALGAVGGSGSQPVRQTEILDRVTAGHWKARMGPGGHNGHRGLASNYHHILRPFGYTGGGYVYIRLERSMG